MARQQVLGQGCDGNRPFVHLIKGEGGGSVFAIVSEAAGDSAERASSLFHQKTFSELDARAQ
ncbi:hypothetical protein [Comamonas sp. 4034]|uniref:hypothetical protein n=1 Tax=Comamonas sp. 4034 TaxID=3156455 RepID=UPI003D1E4CCC